MNFFTKRSNSDIVTLKFVLGKAECESRADRMKENGMKEDKMKEVKSVGSYEYTVLYRTGWKVSDAPSYGKEK